MSLRCLHQRPGCIHAHVGLLKRISLQCLHRRMRQLGLLHVPGADRGPIQLDSLVPADVLQRVGRLPYLLAWSGQSAMPSGSTSWS